MSELQLAVDAARKEVNRLGGLLAKDQEQELVASFLNRLGLQMTEWAKELQLEHSASPVRLDMSRLTLVVDREDRPIPMDRMGSGENWVGYHLVALLALHKLFVQKERPVPRFLFLDQPTQVYFPSEKEEDMHGSEDALKDEDRQAVRRMFGLIFRVCESLAPHFQIIITDHANLPTGDFQEAIVENWRGDKALVPTDWIQDALSQGD